MDYTHEMAVWTPQDAKADAIAKAAAGHNLSIRPLKAVMDAQREMIAQIKEQGGGMYAGTGMVNIVLEAHEGFRSAWVSEEDLLGGERQDNRLKKDTLGLGFSRMLRERNSSRKRDSWRGFAV
jgi:hypothetical protein